MDERVITFRPKAANCTEYIEDDKSATLTLGYHYGDGGDAALILEEKKVICLQANGIDRCDTAGCNGCGWSESGVSYTLNTIDRHVVCYGISPFASNAMKSSNPNSGIYEAKTSRTLDLNGGNPSCNQGGVLVVMERMHEQNELPDTLGCTEQTDIHP